MQRLGYLKSQRFMAMSVKIPAGTQPGATLRLSGQGVKDVRGNVGNQYLEVEVKTPTNLSKDQKVALEDFKKRSQRKKHSLRNLNLNLNAKIY